MSTPAADGIGASPRRWRAFWPYGLIALLYLATSPYHAGLNNPNEMVRVYMTRALVELDTFAIDAVVRDWGWVDDKSKRDGKLYSSKAPLQSLVGVPAYHVGVPLLDVLGLPRDARHVTHVLRIFGSALFGIAFAWLLLAWSRRRAVELGAPEDLGTAVGLTLALGTMLYPYSLLFTGHLLAAVAAGGAYLAAVGLARTAVGTTRFRALGLLGGFAAAAAPFAEYPAALVAGPALVGALWLTPGWMWRAQLAGWFLLGGLPVFALGLWAHDQMWGSAFATGYSFLENRAYEAVHAKGFFGVGVPTLEGLSGALFSPETGLFFYSPVLLLGLAAAVARAAVPSERPTPSERGHRVLAVTALVAFALQVLFISSHGNWRGGWTLGPRYVIPLAPLLGLWVVEALAAPRLWAWIAAFGAASIALTGFAAALYPHLSDVYTNPLATFVWPSYLRGEMSYGLGHALGLEGTAANLVHALPLLFAISYVATAGLAAEPVGLSRRVPRPTARRGVVVGGVAAAVVVLLASIPEDDPVAAAKENRRLWGFWEPARAEAAQVARDAPGLVGRARSRWRRIGVERIGPDGDLVRSCEPPLTGGCRYGEQPWQVLRTETFTMAGTSERLLFLHPVTGEVVRATIPTPARAARAVLRYGLADASVASGNPHPVEVEVRQAGDRLARVLAGEAFGLMGASMALTSTAPLQLELRTENDGSRVFGFDVEFYRE